MLKILRAQGHSYSGEAVDLAVVIDVIRAFTTEQVFFEKGAVSVTLMETVDDLFAEKTHFPGYLTVAEKHGLPVNGADLCNSPSRADKSELSGINLLHATTNGTKACHAVNGRADEVIVTGLSNAEATLRYINKRAAAGKLESLLIMSSHPTGDEDEACADFIQAQLTHSYCDRQKIIDRVYNAKASEKFLDQSKPEFPKADVSYYSRIGDSDFVMKLARKNQLLIVTPEPV